MSSSLTGTTTGPCHGPSDYTCLASMAGRRRLGSFLGTHVSMVTLLDVPAIVGLARRAVKLPTAHLRSAVAVYAKIALRIGRPQLGGDKPPTGPAEMRIIRHSHKTWMIAINVPEIAQAQHLGHTLQNKIQQTYSHVAAEIDTRLLNGLQDRWDKAVADRGETRACPPAHPHATHSR